MPILLPRLPNQYCDVQRHRTSVCCDVMIIACVQALLGPFKAKEFSLIDNHSNKHLTTAFYSVNAFWLTVFHVRVCVCVYACSTQVLLRPIVKEVFMVRAVRDIVPMLRKAFQVAMSGVPGPVFVELPIDTLYVGCPTTTNTQL